MEINASHQTVCDSCGFKLSEHHQEIPSSAISVGLQGEDGTKHTYHACSEGCMADLLNERQKQNKKRSRASEIAELKAVGSNIYWDVDLLQANGMTEKEKKQHHHNNKPYGDVEYADPKNHKYPINTEEHVRAALSYINHPKNAAEYSSSELSAIKSKIHSAAKKFGIQVNASEEAFGSAIILKNKIYYSKCGHWVNIASHADSYDKLDMQEPKDEYCFGCRVRMGMK